ncbi:ATP-binding cassette domain-containing protein, partial [Nocardioides sp. P5_C9_2]
MSIHTPPAAIRATGLTKTFRLPDGTTVTAVDAVDLTVTPGEIVAFLGPNGAGKTTTVDMLLGLTSPTAGTVEVYG